MGAMRYHVQIPRKSLDSIYPMILLIPQFISQKLFTVTKLKFRDDSSLTARKATKAMLSSGNNSVVGITMARGVFNMSARDVHLLITCDNIMGKPRACSWQAHGRKLH